MAEDSSAVPAGHGQLNPREDSQVFVDYEPTELYFRPETGELLLYRKQDAAVLETHGREMCKAVDDFHQANIAVTEAISAYAEKQKSTDPTERAGAEKAVGEASEKLEKANEKLKEKLKPLDSISAGGTTIVELIPIYKSKTKVDSKGKPKLAQYGKKMTYVRSDKMKNHWKKYDLKSAADTQSGQKSVTTKDPNGKTKIDTKKLRDQINKVGFKAKVELVEFDEHSVSGALTSWAEAWNKDLHWEKGISNNVDLTAAAQLMRYTAGVGASTEWAPSEGKMGLKAEAKAEFAVAEAKADATLSIPDRLGCTLQFSGKKEVYPLGAFRIQIALTLAGVVGASATAELAMEIEVEPKKMKMKGVPTTKPKLFAMDEKSKEIEIGGRGTVITPAKAELGVFVGAKADLDVSGAFQWLNPEAEGEKKKFKDFVKLDPAITGMAGLGISGKFEVTYGGGRFHVMMSLSACPGLGLRGKFDANADVGLIGEFVCWFFYQLYHANYEYLDFINERAFSAMKNAQFLAIQTGKEVKDYLTGEAGEIEALVDRVLTAFEASGKRDALASNISGGSGLLLHSTPETKGMLIYQLTRHGKIDWIDPYNYSGIDAFHDRKLAILTILCSVQTVAEWNNVFQHLTPTGTATDHKSSQGLVRDVLGLGDIDMQPDMDNIQARLKQQPARGYRVAMNDTVEYSTNTTDNRYFCMADNVDSWSGGAASSGTAVA